MIKFNDLEFTITPTRGLFSTVKLDNGYKVSVIAGKIAYSTPRRNLSSVEEYDKFEVAVFNLDDEFTSEFFEDKENDVAGWQTRAEVEEIINLVANA